MNTLIKNILAVAVIGTTTVAANAEDTSPNWTYIEAGYAVVNLDDTDINMRGFVINGSYEINENFFATASLAHSTDNMDLGLKQDDIKIGVGAKLPISNTFDVYVGLNYLDTNLSFENDSISQGAYQIGSGVRGMLTGELEADVNVYFTKYSDSEGRVSAGLSLTYLFTEKFGLGFGFSLNKDYKTWGVKARYSF